MTENYLVVFKDDHAKPAIVEGPKGSVLTWLSEQADPDNYDVYVGSSKSYVSGEVFLEQAKLSNYFEMVSTFMPKFYCMNPETDDLLPDGRHLANGMVVLAETPDVRSDINELEEDWKIDRALTSNRWATVTNLELTGDHVKFVALYEDGTKRIRATSVRNGWFVKVVSVTDAVEKKTKRYSDVHALVLAALHRQDMASQGGDKDNAMDSIADEFTKQILGIQ